MIDVADKKYTIRIPEELHADLERIAKEDLRSLHATIVVMLREAAAKRKPTASLKTAEERRQEADQQTKEAHVRMMSRTDRKTFPRLEDSDEVQP
jgi:hypothetical protein